MTRAGFHRVDITPPLGAPLAGFAARGGPCAGVHDELYARALVLDDGRRPLVFVAVDVLALSAELVRDLRERIRRRTAIDPAGVMVSATHTHAGPITMRAFCQPDERMEPAYGERFTAAIEDAVATAWDRRAAARVGVGSGRVTGIGVNRRSPDGLPVDDEIGIVKVEDGAGRVRAVLVNFACHPTVLGPDNLLATGDFPAYMVRRVEESLGPGTFAMFVNGAEGNVSMGHSSELSAIGVITPGRTFERAEELGRRLGEAVLATLPSITCDAGLTLEAKTSTLRLPLKRYPAPAEAAKALAAAETEAAQLAADDKPWEQVAASRTRRLYASIMHYFSVETSPLDDGHLPIEVQAARIGDALFVAAPAEIFVEIGLRLKREARHPLYILGLTNGYMAYLPTRAAYAADGYEVVSSPVTEEAEDRLVAHVQALEAQMFA